MAFERIAVLGPGLLGGSLGLAAKEHQVGTVKFWGRTEEKLIPVRAAGFEASSDFAAVVEGCDLVVLATPIDFFEGLAKELVALGSQALVTDVGSVKGAVHAGAGRLLTAVGIPFVGSHPMAGSEKAGFAFARANLFVGASCFLTNDETVDSQRLADLTNFWKILGCSVEVTDAATHDAIVARVSHLPHVLAALGARIALRNPNESQFGAGGLRDTTRVASAAPAMWRGILLDNREAVLKELEAALADIAVLREALADGEAEVIQDWLRVAACNRENLELSRSSAL